MLTAEKKQFLSLGYVKFPHLSKLDCELVFEHNKVIQLHKTSNDVGNV